jgi:hypothetical protein
MKSSLNTLSPNRLAWLKANSKAFAELSERSEAARRHALDIADKITNPSNKELLDEHRLRNAS